MVDYYKVKFGLRVVTEDGKVGMISHVGTGSVNGAVWVRLDDGEEVIERSHTLKLEN